MNIILIGMRGAGKTTIGEILAKKLGKLLVGTDELIIQKTKLTIPQIVQRFGWDKFRDLEEEVIISVAKRKNIIIDAGGGIVERINNTTRLKKNGRVIWLKVSVDTLLKRIGDDANRPSLTGKIRKEDMIIILKQRKKLYQDSADFMIDTEKKTPKQIAKKIMQYIFKEN